MSTLPPPSGPPVGAPRADTAANYDSWRLAVGTWTIVPITPPTTVDAARAGRAMLYGPLLGLAIGLFAAGLAGLAWLFGGQRFTSALIAAVIYIALVAVASRGLHLDGLADTADGFGSGKRGPAALEIMKRSDIGPFGVITLVVVLALQIFSSASLMLAPGGIFVLVLAVVVGRYGAALAARAGQRPARADGLGAVVIGNVPLVGLMWSATAVIVVGLFATTPAGLTGPLSWLAGVGLAVGAVTALGAWATHRFGGLTGDTLGACVEVATTCVLVVGALGFGR